MPLFIKSFYLGFKRGHTYKVDNTSGLIHKIVNGFVEMLTSKRTKNIQVDGSRISFGEVRIDRRTYLFGGEFILDANNNTIYAFYIIKLNFLLPIIFLVTGILFGIKMWQYDIQISIIFVFLAFVFSFLGIYYQIFRFDGFVTSSIRKVTDTHSYIELTPEQKEWIDDETKCPACGNTISKNDSSCPSCDLFLR
ncbi:MAG: hypothetical protein EHM44_04165 [Ignavibacteriales bacterium]|nr:MAG: hypothetical protein EHM44_04165 [Ignavibacteriales bacterium]